LSKVAGTKIDEAFIGRCITNIRHFRAAAKLRGGSRDIPVKLWVAPPTQMDESELIKEGHYASFGAAGARAEMPGCSLCMGNQAQVREIAAPAFSALRSPSEASMLTSLMSLTMTATQPFAVGQHVVQQGGFAGAQKAREHGHGQAGVGLLRCGESHGVPLTGPAPPASRPWC